ncbi:helix-turn-helix transcriptional regulator [Pectobacterium actinidiae]|uniref:helix-turn-helix domain-containing protein n=1 Tax=Pectobacterium actinidiae TaxID=1507808 RepID=UPI002A815AA1|nr:helix-turn-helix transcriptional regulator [Pectobacterium actinidiae]MDY4317009.1 helix-turn-helix transcriptional regulator [Pectobacterium actinidiae]
MKKQPNYHDVFCQRFKQARQAKGLSQKQLGIDAGIDEFVASPRINRYEKGVHEADTETIQRLADVLDVPLAYFYTADDELAELILAFHALSPKDKPEILALVKSWAERPRQT